MWTALLAAALLPLAASAQVSPTALQPARPPGITVSTTGRAYPTPTLAHVVVRLMSVSPSAFDIATLQPVVDAMVRAGADRNSIAPAMELGAPANRSKIATISGDVQNPTTDELQRGIQTVGAAIAALPNVTLLTATITLSASNCESAQTQARNNAVSLARNKAASIAKALGVHLGGVMSVTAYDSTQQSDACLSTYTATPFNAGMNQSTDYLKLSVTSNVSITYAIR